MRPKLPFFCLLFMPLMYKAQAVLQPVSWQTTWHELSDTTGELLLKATIQDKWHIYSQLQSADGPIPTSFVFTENPSCVFIDKVKEPLPEKAYSEVFQTEVLSFSKEVVFTQKIKRLDKKSFTIKGELEFMSCNDNMCLPPKTIKWEVQVPASRQSSVK